MQAAEFFLKRVDAGLVDAVHHADHFGFGFRRHIERARPIEGRFAALRCHGDGAQVVLHRHRRFENTVGVGAFGVRARSLFLAQLRAVTQAASADGAGLVARRPWRQFALGYRRMPIRNVAKFFDDGPQVVGRGADHGAD